MSSDDAEQAADPDGNGDVAVRTRDIRLPAAQVRTLFASERTLMAWIRTALSLLTFGFAISQFFQYLAKEESTALSHEPRILGGSLVGVGIVLLLLALLEHLGRLRRLLEQGLPKDSPSNLPIGSAIALLAIGVLAMVSIALNWSL